MQKHFFPILLFSISISLIVSSCGGNPQREAADRRYDDSVRKADSLVKFGPPTAIDAEKINDTTYNEKRVTIEGYVRIGSSTFNYEGNASFSLFQRKGEFSSDNRTLTVMLNAGEGKNNMKPLPKTYDVDDILVTGNTGEKIHYGDKVKITGMLHNGSSTYLDGQIVEKIADAPFDYASAGAIVINSTNVNDTMLNGKLVYAEGFLVVPMMPLDAMYTYFSMHVDSIEKEITVDIAYGNAENTVEPFATGATDVIIHSKSNSTIDFKKKVRVYGTWMNSEGVSSRLLTLKAESIEQL